MTLSIITNLASLSAQRNQARTQNDLATTIARLSSGLRINGAADDAAGLAIASRFTAQIRGAGQAARNANDGISLTQTAEGALATIADNLQRIRELAVQSANASNSTSDRASLQLEVSQLQDEIDRVARQTRFNGIGLLDGSFAAQAFQVGANPGQVITVNSIAGARTSTLGVHAGFSVAGLSLGTANSTPYYLTATIGGGASIFLGAVAIDAKAIAAAINASGIAGMTASADPNVVAAGTSASFASAASGTATYTINGVQIALQGTAGAAALTGNRANAVAAINAQSAATGVLALDSGAGIGLVAVDGRNIQVAFAAGSFTDAQVGDFGLALANAFVDSTLSINYVAAPGVAGNVVFAQIAAPPAPIIALPEVPAPPAIPVPPPPPPSPVPPPPPPPSPVPPPPPPAPIPAPPAVPAPPAIPIPIPLPVATPIAVPVPGSGLNVTEAIGSTGTAIGAIDISSVGGANAAIVAVDAALTAIGSQRAALGAVQNRFGSTVGNLQTASANLTASRSRIMDTDYAMETARYWRSQILHQAATAVLAQASLQPSQVLALLR